MLPEIAKKAVREIVNLIATHNYNSVLSKCSISRLSEKDLEIVLFEYGQTYVSYPQNGDDFLSVVEIVNSLQPSWSVASSLWTKEEGRSDLTLELTISIEDSRVAVELDALSVL
jgi:hypothetical protein